MKVRLLMNLEFSEQQLIVLNVIEIFSVFRIFLWKLKQRDSFLVVFRHISTSSEHSYS
jgi:hypothetical protein